MLSKCLWHLLMVKTFWRLNNVQIRKWRKNFLRVQCNKKVSALCIPVQLGTAESVRSHRLKCVWNILKWFLISVFDYSPSSLIAVWVAELFVLFSPSLVLTNFFIWPNFRKNYYACPDDKTFRYMASLYSRSHSNMSLSKEFEGGITNGALWYVGVDVNQMMSILSWNFFCSAFTRNTKRKEYL